MRRRPTDRRRRSAASYRKLFAATTISNLGDGMATIAYPWLASAITRNPLLIAARRRRAATAVAACSRCRPASSPIGSIAAGRWWRWTCCGSCSRCSSVSRCSASRATCPGPTRSTQSSAPSTGLYLHGAARHVAARHGGGAARQLRADVHAVDRATASNLERANGRMWSAEMVTNTFVGPPLGSLLLVVAFSLPFFVDAGVVLRRGGTVASIPGSFRASDARRPPAERTGETELAEGVRWLRGHTTAAADGDHPRADEHGLDDGRRDVRAVRPGGAGRRTVPVHGARASASRSAVPSVACSHRAASKRPRQRHLPGDRTRYAGGRLDRSRPELVVVSPS